MKMHTRFMVLALTFCALARASADPQLTSWLTTYSGQYARVYTTTANRTSGTSATTWANQSPPAYADIPFVAYSASWVYIRAADLPSYVMGPWLNPQGAVGTLWPTNQHVLNRFPRSPAVQSGTKDTTGTGYSGLFVNGVAIFNFADGKAWDSTNLTTVSGPHTKASFYWHRNAPVGEDFNFDYGLGHQNPAGVYHTHQQPIALRYELGDHITYNTSTKNYSESTNAVTAHSPIVGWSYDGYPIYGPYGYSISNNASSGVRRMVSGYVQRDGRNGTDNLTNNLTTIPAWYARFRQAHFAESYSTATTQARPAVSGTNTLGTFAEDFSYYGDLTNSATGQKYVMGTNTFDLDEYNGRFCVTPEFTNGTYAYFIDIDGSNSPTYPYVFGFEYYGNATGGSVSSISETVSTNFHGGPDATLTLTTPTVNTNFLVTLVWSSTEGGTYQIESSTNQTTWTVQKPAVAAAVGVSTTTNYTSTVSNGTAYVRITRTALASYDSTGGASGVVAQTNVQSFSLGNTAPTVANPVANQTNVYGSSFSLTFASNTFTDSDVGQTLTYTASSAALTNTGISFNSATRTFTATTIDSTNGTIAGSYPVQLVATDNGAPALSVTNTFTLVILKAAASVTPNAAARTYGGTNPVFSGTLTGFVAADSIGANYSTTATTNSAPGNYSVTATLTDSRNVAGNYTVTTNTGTLTVSKAPLTVTANNFSRVYGSTNPVFTVAYAGFTNGQTLGTSDLTGAPALATAAATNSSVGSYTITNATGSLASANYSFNLVNGALTITPATLSVTATNASRTYGTTNPIFGGTIAGLLNNDPVTATYASAATTNSAAGTYSIIPALNDPGTRLGNYTITTNNGTLTVSKAALLVAVSNASRAYGSTNPVFTASYSGFANGETSASGTISGSPALISSAATNSAIGTYVITNSLGTLASPDYSFTFTNGTLTVTQATLLVSADAKSRSYGSTNPVLSVSYSGFVNGETAASGMLSGSPSLATSATTNSTVGTYVITNSPGTLVSTNYSLTFSNGTLTVTQAPLFVTADFFTRSYGSAIPTFTGTIIGATNGDVFTESFSCPATTNSPAGTYSITVTVNDPGGRLGNYHLTTLNGVLLIVPATLVVKPDAAARAYGSTNPVFTSSYSGFVNGQSLASSGITGSPSYTTAAVTNSPVGIYAVTNALGTLAATNYMFTFTNGTLTVTQALMTVTPADVSRAYGKTNPVLTGTISGLVNNDPITASYATTATTNSIVGTYPITATLNDPGSLLANYSVTTNQGTLTVTNAAGGGSSVSLVLSNSLVALATNGTLNFTFTDTNSGLAVVVAVTMTPYSASNAVPAFTYLDTYGPGGRAVHLGVESGKGNGDGNWVDSYEGANFAASLVSASSGIATNTVQFGITAIGIRPGSSSASWISSATTNTLVLGADALVALDTNTVALGSTAYSGQLRSFGGQFQLSDSVNPDYFGIVVKAAFSTGTVTGSAATLASASYTNGQFGFSVTGTGGASYIVQATTNLVSPVWISLSTNTAPFTFTDPGTGSFSQRFYRVTTP